jgi:cytochrome c-type biogenesis protein CcsB
MLRKKTGALLLALAIVAMIGAAAGTAFAQQLSAPDWNEGFPRLTGKTIRLMWDAVEGAQSYNIYRNNEVVGTSETNSYSDGDAGEGEHVYAVAAVADGVEGLRNADRSITIKPMKQSTMSGLLVNISFLGFILAMLVYAVYNLTGSGGTKKAAGYAGSALMSICMVLLTIAILLRWQAAGRPPFSNMYESLILFAWSIALIYIVLEAIYKVRIAGIIAAILAGVSIATAAFFDPTIEALVPALQSNWLAYHVLTCFVGYAAFAVSAGASVLYLILKATGKAKKDEEGEVSSAASEIMQAMQSFNFEAVRFGFLFLGVGIITGAVWANEAWGTYWSWDPKETWSLITWFIYAIMIHFKYVSGRFGVKDLNTFNAVCSIVGFVAVMFTYFGVNFVLSGLHSYG